MCYLIIFAEVLSRNAVSWQLQYNVRRQIQFNRVIFRSFKDQVKCQHPEIQWKYMVVIIHEDAICMQISHSFSLKKQEGIYLSWVFAFLFQIQGFFWPVLSQLNDLFLPFPPCFFCPTRLYQLFQQVIKLITCWNSKSLLPLPLALLTDEQKEDKILVMKCWITFCSNLMISPCVFKPKM